MFSLLAFKLENVNIENYSRHFSKNKTTFRIIVLSFEYKIKNYFL